MHLYVHTKKTLISFKISRLRLILKVSSAQILKAVSKLRSWCPPHPSQLGAVEGVRALLMNWAAPVQRVLGFKKKRVTQNLR